MSRDLSSRLASSLLGGRDAKPKTRRKTFAVYPDGREVCIEASPQHGRGMYRVDRSMCAGQDKASAIQFAKDHGAVIEVRVVPNPKWKG